MALFNNLIISNGCAWFVCRNGFDHTRSSDVLTGTPNVKNSEIQRGGWRTIPFILSNEFAERLATTGIVLNLISYLMGSYHMSQVMAASVISIVSGTASLTPVVGAFLSDAYTGRFWAIVMGSIAQLIASLLLTATAACQALRPPAGSREGASPGQLAFLFGALAITTVAAGALRPCSYAFGTDQLDEHGDSLHNKKQIQSFFNWYFFFLYCAILAGVTVLVYIQDKEGWVLGFSVPALFNVIALLLLCLGSARFRYVPPTGSPFTIFGRVLIAAVRKAGRSLPSEDCDLFYGQKGPSLEHIDNIDVDPLPHTNRFKWLDHAAIVTEFDRIPEGSLQPNRSLWLCTVGEVEQLKALLALTPIWLVNMLSTMMLSQHAAFNVPQAARMDRRIGSSGFSIPPASMSIFGLLTLVLWMPFYDRVVVPRVRKMTGHPGGITQLQRIGIGFFLSIVALMVSGLVEMWRRHLAQRRNKILSAMWLVPQHCLYGLGEAFYVVGELEFLYDQLPRNMRGVAGAVFWCSAGIGLYAGVLVMQLVHHVTAAAGSDWLEDNINRGHLDYFFFLLTILQSASFLLFLAVSRRYTYRGLHDIRAASSPSSTSEAPTHE